MFNVKFRIIIVEANIKRFSGQTHSGEHEMLAAAISPASWRRPRELRAAVILTRGNLVIRFFERGAFRRV